MQHERPRASAREAFKDFKAALQRPHLAVGELADAAFERSVGRRWTVEALPPRIGEPERQATAVFRVGLAIDEPGADQSVDRSADGRSAALHPRGNLIERRRLGLLDG